MLKLNRLPLLPIYNAAHARTLALNLPLNRRQARIVVPGQPVGATHNNAIEARLTRLYNACGCGAGTLAFLVAMLIWVGVWLALPAPLYHTALVLGVGVVTALAATGFGKWAGLMYARHQLIQSLHQLALTLESHT